MGFDIDLAVRDHLEDNAALYSIDPKLMAELEPTVIVTQALCDVCAVSDTGVRAVISDLNLQPKLLNLEPMSLDDAIETIMIVGKNCGVRARAEELIRQGRQTIEEAEADVMVIALCGFEEERAANDMDILKSNLNWEKLPCVRNNRVHVVDGNAYFSRSGPRLIDSRLIMEKSLWPND